MKRWIGFSAILILLAFTAGCPYTAKAPLGDPDRNSFDVRLVGLWMGCDPDNEADSTLIRVIPFNDAEYYVEMVAGQGAESFSDVYNQNRRTEVSSIRRADS
jgi:hypothetical protein